MQDSALIGKALAVLDADGLRTIVREILPWLDESTHARLVNALIDRAARGASGWTPPGPSARRVTDVQVFAAAAIRRGRVGAATRTVLVKALRRASEKRVAGVTEEKRRRHYCHAARLVAACAVADPTPETAMWVATLRAKYRRYSALHDEFDQSLKGR